jgi:hypothetical protein
MRYDAKGCPRLVSRTRRVDIFRAATTSGTLRMDAWVRVRGRTREMSGPGIMRKQNHWIHQVIRRGKVRRGTRQSRERREERQTVPRRVEKVCWAAAWTMTLEGVSRAKVCR